MGRTLIYRLSIGLAILLALGAFFTLLGWLAVFFNGVGRLPALNLIPWTPLAFVALAAINCTLRAELIVRRRPAAQ